MTTAASRPARFEVPAASDPQRLRGVLQGAYRAELSDWVHSAATGDPVGPSAWDGYVAAVAARAGVRSLVTGFREPVEPGPRPDLYASDLGPLRPRD
jgi:predicted dehydrogenase